MKDAICCVSILLVRLVFFYITVSVYLTICVPEVEGGGRSVRLDSGRDNIDFFPKAAMTGIFIIIVFQLGRMEGSWLIKCCRSLSFWIFSLKGIDNFCIY